MRRKTGSVHRVNAVFHVKHMRVADIEVYHPELKSAFKKAVTRMKNLFLTGNWHVLLGGLQISIQKISTNDIYIC